MPDPRPVTYSTTMFAMLVPYRFRWLHRARARLGGTWTPCPLCRDPFGGHEQRIGWDGSLVCVPAGRRDAGKAICPACARAGKGAEPFGMQMPWSPGTTGRRDR